MNRRELMTSALAAALVGRAARGQAAVVTGRLDFARATGAIVIRGERLLLTASDRNGVVVLGDAATRLRSGEMKVAAAERLETALNGRVTLDDLQDAAWDGAGDAYLVTSHARTPQGDAPEARYRLSRLRFDATGKLLEARQTDALLQGVVNQVPFLADAIRRTPARTGLNIEGLAWDPQGHLIVGLRAPTVTESRPRPHGGQEDAVVVRVKNPEALFASPAGAAELGDTVKLDLHGQGIRGMCHDPGRKAFWLLSGLSAAPTHPVRSPWNLWLWDGSSDPRPAKLPPGVDLEEPAAVCRIEIEGRPHLLLIEGGTMHGRYALFPSPV